MFESTPSGCMLGAVASKIMKAAVLTVLALWGLAAMHCKLEALPGLDFLRTCCLVESDCSPASTKDCDSDGCRVVEEGRYRAEEQTVSAPDPLLVLALMSSVFEAPLLELPPCALPAAEPLLDLSRVWQFLNRTALLPRAPSFLA